MIELNLRRYIFTDKCTVGELTIKGMLFKCYTLEDTVRNKGVKIYGQTAIPEGLYRISIRVSPKMGKEMPYIDNVENFSGIMLHSGTTVLDTLGCVLVGKDLVKLDEINYTLANSRKAYSELWMILQMNRKDDISINIVNEFISSDTIKTIENDIKVDENHIF